MYKMVGQSVALHLEAQNCLCMMVVYCGELVWLYPPRSKTDPCRDAQWSSGSVMYKEFSSDVCLVAKSWMKV